MLVSGSVDRTVKIWEVVPAFLGGGEQNGNVDGATAGGGVGGGDFTRCLRMRKGA